MQPSPSPTTPTERVMRPWPSIPVAGWQDTRDTVHLYTQVVGKIRLANEPTLNHWWISAMYVTTTPTHSCLVSCSPRMTQQRPPHGGTVERSNGRPERTIVADTCTHLDTVTDAAPSSDGCEDCEPNGGRWVHLRLCVAWGHVGCCDNSSNRHVTALWRSHDDHPLVRSYEPGEDWWGCYPEALFFNIDGAPSSPSHP